MSNVFQQYQLENDTNLFQPLFQAVQFEPLGKGRKGTVIVDPDEDRGTPIVRTTSRFHRPAHCFNELHKELSNQIQERAAISAPFNNALYETYTNVYSKMGLHSDMALDLQDDTFIALYSCYKNGPSSKTRPRTLVIQPKEESDDKTIEIPLVHDSVVVFSVDTNRLYRHKIILHNAPQQPPDQWLGITLRRSKTYVQYRNQEVFFEDGTPLTIATEEQRNSFFPLRKRENQELDFRYPQIAFTISESDLMPPVIAKTS